MSVELTRLIEVKLPDVNGYVWNENELDDIIEPEDGVIYKIRNDYSSKYRIYHKDSNSWEKTNICDCSWHLVTYWGDNTYGYDTAEEPDRIFGTNIELREITNFSNNCGTLRDKYLNPICNEYYFKERGIPDDISDKCKALLHVGNINYWGHTYVLLSEWQNLHYDELQKLENEIKIEVLNSKFNNIDSKLDTIISTLSNTKSVEDKSIQSEDDNFYKDYIYKDDTDNIILDKFLDIETINTEMSVVYHIVHELYGYILPENIRINYYFS